MDLLTPRQPAHFLEGNAPALPGDRLLRARADQAVMLLAGAALSLTLATVVGDPGPDAFFEIAPGLLGFALVANALIGMGMERYRSGFARTLLTASALGFAGIGFAYAGLGEAWRIVVGCFAPSLLCIAGAVLLGEERRLERRHA